MASTKTRVRRKSQVREMKQRKPVHPNSLKNLRPFTGGPDPRRNTKGPLPKDAQELNILLDEIFAEETTFQKHKTDKLRAAINKLLLGKAPIGTIHILERRFGKIPQPVDVTSGGEKISTISPDQVAQRVAELMERAKQRKKNAGN